MSNVGLWDRWYARGLEYAQPYGGTLTYELGAAWLADCEVVEDWGCGKGWLSTLVAPPRYRGIDGSQTPFASVVADLATYRSSVPGVFMRHVLEHNYDWRAVLDNALASATQRFFLVLFTPLAARTGEIAYADDPGVPDIAFRLEDLTSRVEAAGFTWTVETLASVTQYEVEHVLRCER